MTELETAVILGSFMSATIAIFGLLLRAKTC